MNLTDLPRFLVTSKSEGRYHGRFDPSPWIGNGHCIGLHFGAGRFLWCEVGDVDSEARTCSLAPDEWSESFEPNVDESYPYMEWYWGSRAEIVLDEERTWNRATFEARAMVLYPAEGGGRMGTPLAEVEQAGAEGGGVVPGGWDHEHCEICNQTIGNGGDPDGYVSDSTCWICVECYRDYVVPRSLGFMPNHELKPPISET